MSSAQPPPNAFSAIVLAGRRSGADPLAAHTGVAYKALLEINGAPLALTVIRALRASDSIGDILLCGPAREALEDATVLNADCQNDARISWHPPGPSPSTSAYQLMQHLPGNYPVLVTSADQPFFSTAVVEEFSRKSIASGADVTIGFVPYALVREAFPELSKTVLRFSDGEYCGCNLFSFLTPAGRRAADYWRAIEDARKNPLQVVRLLGWWPLLRYKLGWLSLPAALKLLSKRFGMLICPVLLPHAEAAVDIDSVADYETVRRILGQPKVGPGI